MDFVSSLVLFVAIMIPMMIYLKFKLPGMGNGKTNDADKTVSNQSTTSTTAHPVGFETLYEGAAPIEAE
jgi:hypothetical protein